MIRNLLLQLINPLVYTVVIVVIAGGLKKVIKSTYHGIIDIIQVILLVTIWVEMVIGLLRWLIGMIPF